MNFTDEMLNDVASSFLRRIRKQNGITEGELAVLLKISQQQVSRYENGKTMLTIGRINQYLNVFGLNWECFTNEIIKSTGKPQDI
ncbi:TPA: helix-turn-helix domain-containing protein [Providencia alcalifaciens]|uniref:Helix-turn-helix domain-containing protein n=3 Tax=Providencia alcalifaciens TaxID=126385 RepID=A0AAW9VA21_9GAMM|nr:MULTISPECIES: helix-turn-helix transcriptional regulator [Providencia]ATG15544.1 XRE family transcriptional regulator [Providencia alcalifaciens]EEB47484.1 DNA-binding helix-turn-helix protein [Providencia alcalifaciens DSM 30120]EKT62100.1 fimbrial operon regulator [Providencia alcalifaciens Dmel2]ETT04561.1 DNA-binding helix-turn-helix protein [Providencia alcalifaciens F90-2004]EUC95320.1 DNA-binding helix-turn-helix protein [Providencia alcalifaciens PAL-2]